MKETMLDARSERMLELLSQGGSSRDLAVSLGYQEGTMRVYLHHLYRKIGVANKTEAVVWYLRREKPEAFAVAQARGASSEGSQDLFGDMALDEDLFTALGAMGRLIGPYGRVWEVGLRLKGGEVDEAARQRRDSARGLWRALLEGEWIFGKRLHDASKGEGLLLDAPSEAVLLAALLLMGGYSDAADRLIAQITSKRRVRPSAAPREVTLLRALDGALDGKQEGHAALRELVAERGTPPVLRQVALALLFHARVAHKDEEGAREAANALWGEAETARRELEAMGERPFGGRRQVSSAKSPVRRSSREKAVAR